MLLDDAVVIGVAVEKQQVVLLSQCDTSLIQDAVAQSDILALGLRCNLYHLHRAQLDAVGFGKCHHVGDEHSGTRRQPTYGQATLQHAVNTVRQFEALAQRIFRTACIVAPVELPHL